jgi:hypothetical protein
MGSHHSKRVDSQSSHSLMVEPLRSRSSFELDAPPPYSNSPSSLIIDEVVFLREAKFDFNLDQSISHEAPLPSTWKTILREDLTSNPAIAVSINRRRPSSTPRRNELEHVRMHLIEMITYTLEVDLKIICQELLQDINFNKISDKEVNSLLTDQEEEELFRIATILVEMRQKYTSNRWNLTLNSERAAIRASVIEPTQHIKVCIEYLLGLLSTYAEYVLCPFPPLTSTAHA